MAKKKNVSSKTVRFRSSPQIKEFDKTQKVTPRFDPESKPATKGIIKVKRATLPKGHFRVEAVPITTNRSFRAVSMYSDIKLLKPEKLKFA
nr:MAG: hypothetical protein [Apis mellifra filamentous-like virus]